MELWHWILFGLLYLLIGSIFTLNYILNYKPADRTAKLGLFLVGWVLVALIDILLDMVKPLGGKIKTLSNKMTESRGPT